MKLLPDGSYGYPPANSTGAMHQAALEEKNNQVDKPVNNNVNYNPMDNAMLHLQQSNNRMTNTDNGSQ